MTQPKLAVAASGYEGRGYRKIFEGDGTEVVMSVTTALGVIEKGGLQQWAVDLTAAYAIANVDALMQRSEEQGFKYLRYYHNRLTGKKLDDPNGDIDLNSYHTGVLNDLADRGTWMHSYVEDVLNDGFPEYPFREDLAEMVIAFHEWFDNLEKVKVISIERTVFGHNYAGTYDIILEINEVRYLIDVKTSKKVYDSHVAQLAALGAASTTAVEVPAGTEGAKLHTMTPSVGKLHNGQTESWWVEEPVPAFEKYAVLQIRPSDVTNDGEYIAPFCKLHVIPQKQVDAGFKMFEAAVDLRIAQRELKQAEKEEPIG